jgi:triphosphoribosyl-dephospho-CoA synthase
MKPLDQCWSVSQAVGLATLLEASAPKLGNVHPNASFDNMHFGHFVSSAIAVAEVFEQVATLSVGELVLSAVQATVRRAGCNTNLGTILLLAPLAKAVSSLSSSPSSSSPSTQSNGVCPVEVSRYTLQQSVAQVLERLTLDDSQQVYEAIRVAQPGGLGKQSTNDVAQAAQIQLCDAMRQVADNDAVARQYTNNFKNIFECLLPWLDMALPKYSSPLDAIQHLQIQAMAWQPDGLIIRKCGIDLASRVQQRAQQVLQLIETNDPTAQQQILLFDQYLRSDGNRLNPGTTADLIAAALFCRLVSLP